MTAKPSLASEYHEEDLSAIRAGCLYLATKIGDLMEDIVVVGGLVPSLLIDQDRAQNEEIAPSLFNRHAGTKDIDLGLALSILDEERYLELSDRLRSAGFAPDTNWRGNPTRHRWRLQTVGTLTVDFLIQPSRESDTGGVLRDIEQDFAAVITPGLHLAFLDRRMIRIAGFTTAGERAERDLWVCGPGAFFVLKAIALRIRGENKDAYDLAYVANAILSDETMRNDVRSFVIDNWTDTHVQRALDFIKQDFGSLDGVGPMRTAEFLRGGPDDEIQADVAGLVSLLLRAVQTQ